MKRKNLPFSLRVHNLDIKHSKNKSHAEEPFDIEKESLSEFLQYIERTKCNQIAWPKFGNRL